MRQSWVLLSFSPLLVLVVVGCAVIPTSLPGATSLIGTAIPPSLPSAVNVATTDAQSAFHTAVADSVQPVITSVSPIYAEQIQRIVVKGNNFGHNAGYSCNRLPRRQRYLSACDTGCCPPSSQRLTSSFSR